MMAVESDTEYCAQLPLCDTDLGEGETNGNDERREDVAVLTSQDGIDGEKSINSKRNHYQSTSRMPRLYKLCRWRQGAVLLLGVFLTVVALTLVVVGGVRSRQHTSIKLLHIQSPVDLKSILHLKDENFTFAQLMSLTNVALDRPASQSSTSTPETEIQDDARNAVDGNLSSCSNTGLERRPKWQVDLQRSRAVKSVRIHGSSSFKLQNLVIYVTASANITNSDNVCGRVKDAAKNAYVRVKCADNMQGRHIVIELDNGNNDSFQALRLCEVMVFLGKV